MQTTEILGQAKPVVRLPEMDEVPSASRSTLDTRAKRPGAATRAVITNQPEVGVGSNRNPRRFGAGF